MAEPATRAIIDRIWKGVRRSWATARRRLGHGGPAYMEAESKRSPAGTARAGPPDRPTCFTGEGSLERSTAIAPWGIEVRLELSPGEPYVARDDVEAEQLAELDALGFIKQETGHGEVDRIPAYKAFRMCDHKRSGGRR